MAIKSHYWNQCFNFTLQSSTSRRLSSVLLKSSFGIKMSSYINYLHITGSQSILDLQELGLQHLLFSSGSLGNGNMSVPARGELFQISVCFLRLNHQETTTAEQSRQYQRDWGAVTQSILASWFWQLFPRTESMIPRRRIPGYWLKIRVQKTLKKRKWNFLLFLLVVSVVILVSLEDTPPRKLDLHTKIHQIKPLCLCLFFCWGLRYWQ